MNMHRHIGTTAGLGLSLAMFTALGSSFAQAQEATPAPPAATAPQAAPGQQATLEGLIIGRDGPVMAVRTADQARTIVVLSDSTKAEEKGGLFGWSHKNLAITELTPGLSVKVEGTYDPDHKLVANRVIFTAGAMKTAKQIDAGLNPLSEQMAQTQDQLRSARKSIEDTQAGLDQANQQIAAVGAAGEQNKQAIGQTNGRIGQLDQYDTQNTLTINFRNGSAVVAKKDKDALTDFVKNAATLPGAVVEVQGYASKVGSPALNQRLSAERATNVLTIIQQAGVPLTRILTPAAMGTVEQVADNHTRAGQAQNRRVVVTVVVNKGITGGDNANTNTGATTSSNNTASLNQPAQ